MSIKLPTLYKRTSSGAVQEWTVEIQGAAYRTHHGQHGGKIVTTEWFIAEPANIGRANERSATEQALFEARATWAKKVESGAREKLAEIDNKEFHTPMLAKKWEDRENKVRFPLYSQPKLDGLRAVISRHGAKSRNGKDWVTVPHILAALRPIFEARPDLVLDGELYTHEYKDDFNTICSLVKKTKPSAADIAECAAKVQFWWYDVFSDSGENNLSFSQRSKLIAKLCDACGIDSKIIVRVPTHNASNKDELDALYGAYLEDGYEGQMVRLDQCYENKRSASLLKRKTFSDAEYLIIDICEGNGNKSGMAGYAILERDDGVRFRSNIKGQHSFLVDLLKNRSTYIGQYGTVTYFNLTPDGIPRFPYLTRLRSGPSCD